VVISYISDVFVTRREAYISPDWPPQGSWLDTVWYHGECVDVKEGDYKRGEKYKCNECKEETKTSNDGEMDTQRKDIGKDGEKPKQTTKTMTSALLKLNEEVEMLKQELSTLKQQQKQEKEEHQQEVDRMTELIRQLEEKNRSHNNR